MSSPSGRVAGRALSMGVACAVGLLCVYLIGVHTTTGQRFEDAVLRAAARLDNSTVQAHALRVLDAISVPSVVAGSLVIILIAMLRRRIFLGLLAVGMIAVSIATTEVFQYLLSRPLLLAHGYRREDQSFPSGHTTVSAALMCGLVMVMPYRLRGATVVLTSLAAAGVAVATVTAGWHRPSDTLGADLIVVGWTCAATAVLAWCGRVRERTIPTPVGRALRRLLTGGYAGVVVVALAVAAAAVADVLSAPRPRDVGASTLLAGCALALAGSAAVAVSMLALLRRVDLDRSRMDPVEGSPDVERRYARVDRPTGP
jgi:membrane-associated phospholipid phosphatase